MSSCGVCQVHPICESHTNWPDSALVTVIANRYNLGGTDNHSSNFSSHPPKEARIIITYNTSTRLPVCRLKWPTLLWPISGKYSNVVLFCFLKVYHESNCSNHCTSVPATIRTVWFAHFPSFQAKCPHWDNLGSSTLLSYKNSKWVSHTLTASRVHLFSEQRPLIMGPKS